jgi:hypothetical protein
MNRVLMSNFKTHNNQQVMAGSGGATEEGGMVRKAVSSTWKSRSSFEKTISTSQTTTRSSGTG